MASRSEGPARSMAYVRGCGVLTGIKAASCLESRHNREQTRDQEAPFLESGLSQSTQKRLCWGPTKFEFNLFPLAGLGCVETTRFRVEPGEARAKGWARGSAARGRTATSAESDRSVFTA